MNLERSEVAALLQQQATSLQVTVLSLGMNSELEIDGTRYQACVLSKSSDYYRYRLNIHGTSITMLVVGGHDTRVHIPVLALDEGYFYAPAEAPRWYDPDAVRTRKDAMVVIGGLLSGVEEAYRQVEQMKRSTRYCYLARMREYLNTKQGRQLVV
jgi:hypothetical protein